MSAEYAGITLSLDRVRIAYTLNWRSKEISGQDEAVLVGAIAVGRRF